MMETSGTHVIIGPDAPSLLTRNIIRKQKQLQIYRSLRKGWLRMCLAEKCIPITHVFLSKGRFARRTDDYAGFNTEIKQPGAA